jgi:hypothetical protein
MAAYSLSGPGERVFVDVGKTARPGGVSVFADPLHSAPFTSVAVASQSCRDASARPVLPLSVVLVHVCDRTWKAVNLNPLDLLVDWRGSGSGVLGVPAGTPFASSVLYFAADASPVVTLRHKGQVVTVGVAPGQRPPCNGPRFPAVSAMALAGDGQSIVVGDRVPVAPTVQLTGPDGEPVVGATVRFSMAAGYGFVSTPQSISDAAGTAAVGAWELSERGPHRLSVAVSGVPIVGPVPAFTASARHLAWSSQVTPGENLSSVWGVSATAMFSSGGYRTLNFYDGVSWSAMPHPADGANRYQLHGRSLSDVYGVGQSGVIRYDGTNWSTSLTTTGELVGVWVAPDGQAFVAGDGTFFRFDGASWIQVPTGLSDGPNVDRIESVWGSSPSNVYAAGRRGIVLRWDGSRLQTVHTGYSDQVNSIFGFGPEDVYMATAAGVMRFDGRAWTLTPLGVGRTPIGIWGSSRRNLYVSTVEGELLRYDGRSWQAVANLGSRLSRLFGLGPAQLYIAGEERPGRVHVGS